ncbi:MAG TPA: hypothetical protein VHL80_19200 [Polyangia bacterium]|nr:hypothetical protein [Polyangia bacterium]
MLVAAGPGWAGGKKSASEASKEKEATPASFNKTLQWEEKVVGPKDKGVDHAKIAAMQEQGRRDEAARKQAPPKKPERPVGVNDPASSTIPTQDIEKPHAVTMRKASYAAPAPKHHDELDNLLAENGVGSSEDGGRDGLNKVFGGGSSAKHKVAAKHGKRARHRR